jgi:LacI family transcriptional regulator
VTRELLGSGRPRALICFNDRLAFGACQALADAGLEVPGDASVVSFDDYPIASWIRPQLTTIALPHHELGRKAVDVLFAGIERARGEDGPDDRTYRVPMPLRDRSSVAPRPGLDRPAHS